MRCEKIKELLPAYHSHALKGWVIMEIQLHLRMCESCRQEEQGLSSAWNMLSVLEPIEPSPHFRERFWARVREEEEKKASRSFFPRLVPALAGFAGVWVIGLMGGILLYSHRTPLQEMNSAVNVFTAPYPPNSIERAVLAKP